MSTTIDQKVVEAKFDNVAFLRGVQSTLNALDELTKKLQLDHVARGVASSFGNIKRDLKIDDSAKNVENSAGRISTAFGSLRRALHIGDSRRDLNAIPGDIDRASAAAGRFSLTPMLTAVSGVTKQFSVMEIAGVTAIAAITHKALVSAQQFARQFTTAPIRQGLEEYETNLNAIQTILANTGREGAKGLREVNKALEELNIYSDKTIYNFSEMARNIGTFTAAGVDLEVATGAIKGIANLAALSGSNAQQAATAMYQLSQALASGTVKLIDWNSVVNAGMGGKVFQEALKETARNHGVAVDAIIKKEGSFRDSLQNGWLTSKILTETLAKFTGDLTAKQLKQMGYTEQQIRDIIKQGKVATDAATKVKTFTQLVGTLKEAAGSGWAKTWQLLLGDFGEAKELFTGINNVLGGFIQKSAETRNKVLGDWKELGGRTALIKGIENIFTGLIGVLAPVRDAFREIFPRQTGRTLLELTKNFVEFTEKLRISKDGADLVKRTFAGIFAIFSIVRGVVSELGRTFGGFFGVVAENAEGFFEFTAQIGDWLVALDEALRKNGDVKKFFDDLENGIRAPIRFLSELSSSLADLFDSLDMESVDRFTSALDVVGDRLSPIETVARNIGNLFEGLGRILGRVGEYLADQLGDIGGVITDVFQAENFNTALDVINTSLLGGILLLLRNFFNNGFNIDFGGGFIQNVTNALQGVSDTLSAMQAEIKSNAILKIAAALALLTVSIVILSTIDSGKLTTSLAGIAAGLVGLSAVMTLLSTNIDTLGSAKLIFISTAMIAISTALIGLATAVKIMSTIEAGDMYRGLFGIGLGLGIIAKAMHAMPMNMVLQSVALNGIATALIVLATAVKLFGTISWDEMGRGLASLAGSMVILAGGMRLMPKNMVMQAAALTILAGALNAIALAVKLFGTISWDEMLRGLVALGGSLAIIAIGMRLMPKGMLRQAVALVAIAGALNVIALAIKGMSTMSWEEIARGLVALGGSLLILALGLNLMNGAIFGAAALLVAAGALAVLAPVLIALGSVSWSVLLQGLVALAGVFTVLGLAGYILAPVVPVIIGLAAAVVLVGAGLALAGVGALAFAAAWATFVGAASVGVSVLADILGTFVASIPGAMEAFGLGLVKLAGALAKGGPEFFAAFVTIIESMLDAIIENTPRIGEALIELVETGLDVLVTLTPQVAAAGLTMILELLKAIDSRIVDIVDTATSIVVKFVTTLGENSPELIQAGVDFVIDFINGVAEAIRSNSEALGEAGANMGTAIIEGLGRGLIAGIGKIADIAGDVAEGALNAAKGVLGIESPSKEFERIGQFVNQGLARGLKGNRQSVLDAYKVTAMLLREAIQTSAKDVKDAQERLAELQKKNTKVKTEDGSYVRKSFFDKDLAKAIKEAEKDLARALKENKASKAAYRTLTKDFKDERDELVKLSRSYDKVTRKLEKAQQALADARQTRDDYNKNVREQYSDLPDITGETKVADARKDFQKQIVDTQKFVSVIQELRKLGLNDALYEEFLEKGPAILPFLEEMLAGGKISVDEFNALSETIAKEATALGKTASKELYQAGVDAAKGLVDGLKKEQKAIAEEMDKIADTMVAAIKKALGIKSPSREFAKIASWSLSGLVKGLKDSAHISERAFEQVGKDALLAMRKTIEGLAEVTQDMDARPTITPVLDLTDVEREARKLLGIFPTPSIRVDGSYSGAREASAGYDANRRTYDDAPDTPDPRPPVVFQQYNTSPKALSEAEIYRQTKSQLSVAKGVLADA